MTIKIRKSQVIQPFGVGSIIEGEGGSYVVKDISEWRVPDMEDISIPSLVEGIPSIRRIMSPKNDFELPVQRFPQWNFCPNPSCRRLYKLKYQDKNQCRTPECKNKQLVPMRWVMVCEDGHMADIDWSYYCHLGQVADTGRCQPPPDRGSIKFFTGQGGDFDQMFLECKECGAKNNFEFLKPVSDDIRFDCPGYQAWVFNDNASCDKKAVFQPRGSAIIHYPKILSSLDLSSEESLVSIRDNDTYQQTVQMFRGFWEEVPEQQKAGVYMTLSNIAEEYGYSEEEARQAFHEDVISQDNSPEEPIDETYDLELLQKDILFKEYKLITSAENINISTLKKSDVDIGGLEQRDFIKRLIRIENLVEVRAFFGFNRVNPDNEPITADIENSRDWIPGVKILGEGIFFEIDHSKINSWKENNRDAINLRISPIRKAFRDHPLGEEMGAAASPEFILIHTLSHIFISKLAFQAGYSVNSIRERIYCFPEINSFGVLIYTADSDSEGSLGGLQELGKASKFSNILMKSIEDSRWCSNDPICRESKGLSVQQLNRSACHSCSLLPETSCIYNNTLLDRVLLTGEPEENSEELNGFFNE